jgi:hypothetical protein
VRKDVCSCGRSLPVGTEAGCGTGVGAGSPNAAQPVLAFWVGTGAKAAGIGESMLSRSAKPALGAGRDAW